VKVLIVGGGGREHALAWKLKQEDPDAEIVAAPGNPGIAALGRCVAVPATDVERLVALAEHERPDFTLVGHEAPLARGLVDRFRERRLPIFGPTRAAARIEASKAFAKQLMLDAGVPTAMAFRHTEPAPAKRAARELGAPVVIKASGLAAGKGVIVCQTLDEADRAIDFMLRDEGFGAAGAEILVEEFMEGEELSIFYLADGVEAFPLVPAQDHKRLLDGDRGPNTGGMGAYAPVTIELPFAAGEFTSEAVEPEASEVRALAHALRFGRHIVAPTLAALRERGSPFTGLLYAGVMLTVDGPKVVEFNCRFGDPETQSILPAMSGFPVGDLLRSIAAHGTLPSVTWATAPDFLARRAVTTVLATAGYPDTPRKGDVITLPPIEDDGVLVFHAGTALNDRGELVTAGGRVLAVTGIAKTFEDAKALSTRYSALVDFAGKQFRTDIGWREVARRARAS